MGIMVIQLFAVRGRGKVDKINKFDLCYEFDMKIYMISCSLSCFQLGITILKNVLLETLSDE